MSNRFRLNARELSTVLAALRAWQEGERSAPELRMIATDGGTLKALTNREIDSLCERLNCGGRP